MEWFAVLTPLLLWVMLTFASPFLKTYRHRLSGMFSGLSGVLMFASLRLDAQEMPLLLCGAAVAVGSMFVALLWSPAGKELRQRGR
jgi:hypothetical protein